MVMPHTFLFSAILLLSMFKTCQKEDIVLEKVRHTPPIFRDEMNFGTSKKNMVEKNEFLLETGEIDTVSELPVSHVAYIAVSSKTIQLKLAHRTKQGNQIKKVYTGEGYHVSLSYTDQQEDVHTEVYPVYMIIQKGKERSEYQMIGEDGYF